MTRRRQLPFASLIATAVLAWAASLAVGAPAFSAAGADDRFASLPGSASPEWQKASLEDRLQEKLVNAISSAIPENQFVVKVVVDLKPEAKRGPASIAAAAKATLNLQEPRFKTDIPLTKLDMSVALPIDREPAASRDPASVIETPKDIFSRIERVRATIIIDGKQDDEKKALVERVGRVMLGEFEPAIVNLVVEKAPLVTEKKPEAPKPAPAAEAWDWKRWLIELKIVVGLVASASLLLVFGVFVLLGQRRTELRRISILEAQNAREESLAQAKLAAMQAPSQAAAANSPTAGGEPKKKASRTEGAAAAARSGNSGFTRFKSLTKENPRVAASLVRQWLKAPQEGSAEALALLPREISTEDMGALFEHLNVDDRREWKRALATDLDEHSPAVADDFVSRQIIEAILAPAPKVDEKLDGLLGELKLSECVDLAARDPLQGGVLVNLLPTAQVGRIFALLNAEQASQVTRASMKLSEDEIQKRAPALQQVAAQIRKAAKPSSVPFVERSVEVLREVGPVREASIFKALAEAGEHDALRAAARRQFPATLLLQLPSALLKSCLDQLPLAARADTLLSRPPEERDTLARAYGDSSSRARQMLDLELEEATRDSARARRVERNGETLWREFVETARYRISSDDAARDAAEELLSGWLTDLTGKAHGDSARAA